MSPGAGAPGRAGDRGPGCSPTGMLRAGPPDSPLVAWTSKGKKEPAFSPQPERDPGPPWACDTSSQAGGATSIGRSRQFPVCAVTAGRWLPKGSPSSPQRVTLAKWGGHQDSTHWSLAGPGLDEAFLVLLRPHLYLPYVQSQNQGSCWAGLFPSSPSLGLSAVLGDFAILHAFRLSE